MTPRRTGSCSGSWTTASRSAQSKVDFTYGGQEFEQGTYIVEMTQAHRGLANTALGIGDDVSASITQLYAPPGAWSHGYLWGADIVTIPQGPGDFHLPQQREIKKPAKLSGGVDRGKADRLRARDRLGDCRSRAERARRVGRHGADRARGVPGRSRNACGRERTSSRLTRPPRRRSTRSARSSGLHFQPALAATLPALDAVEHTPRIAVLTGAVNQDVWSLRNLGFTADPISTATINTALTDPLEGYDVVFNTGSLALGREPAGANAAHCVLRTRRRLSRRRRERRQLPHDRRAAGRAHGGLAEPATAGAGSSTGRTPSALRARSWVPIPRATR